MNWATWDILGKINFARVSPEQRARLQPHLEMPAVQAKLAESLVNVPKTIDVMSAKVRQCLMDNWVKVFDTIAAEREQRLLLVEGLRHKKSHNWHRVRR